MGVYKKLVSKECPVTGEIALFLEGTIMSDVMFGALDGALIAHDILEHQCGLDKIGGVADELIALGGVWYVRGQFEDITRDQNYHTAAEHVSSDLLRLFRDYMNTGFEMPLPKRANCQVRESLEDVLDVYSAREMLEEAGRGSGCDVETFKRGALLLMCKGYNMAKRRFKRQIKANSMFWNIAAEVSRAAKWIDFPGQEFRLYYDEKRSWVKEIYIDEFYY